MIKTTVVGSYPRIHYVHPDCGLGMLPRGVADAKMQVLVRGRDRFEGVPLPDNTFYRGIERSVDRVRLGLSLCRAEFIPLLRNGLKSVLRQATSRTV